MAMANPVFPLQIKTGGGEKKEQGLMTGEIGGNLFYPQEFLIFNSYLNLWETYKGTRILI